MNAPSLLCGDAELDFLKREIAKINQATRDAKRENDYADWQKDHVAPQPSTAGLPTVPSQEGIGQGGTASAAPEVRNARWWKDYGERYEESGW